MTPAAPASGTPSAAGGWVLLVACALLAGAKLLLVGDDEVVARTSPLDQVRFLEMARSLSRGQWLGPWGLLTLIREPGYPLFVAAVGALGVPLRVATELLLLAAAGLFCAALCRAGVGRIAVLAAYAAVAFVPHSLVVNRDALPAAFYGPLLLCALAGLVFALEAPNRRRLLFHAAWSGMCLGALWITRPEKLALLPLLGVAAGWDFLRRRRAGTRPALLRAGLLAAAVAVPMAGVIGSVAAINRAQYGIFATTAVTAPGYLAANRALTSIEQRAPRRFVPVPAEVRARAYAVSPAFRELRPVLEGPSWARVVSCNVDRVCDDLGAGYFRWLLREAAADAGYLGTAVAADAFFARIADEVGSACASGALSCRASRDPFLHPVAATWLPHVGESLRGVFAVAFRGRASQVVDNGRDRPATPAAVRRLFDDVANRRAELTRNGDVHITGRVEAAGAPVVAAALETRTARFDAALAPVGDAAAPAAVEFVIDFAKRRRNFEVGDSRLVFQRESGAPLELPLARAIAGDETVGDLAVSVVSVVESERESPLRQAVRRALWLAHGPLYDALAFLALVAAVVVLRFGRRDVLAAPAFGVFLLVATAAAVRLALLVLVDASSFPTRSSRYVYAAVPLAGCAALLLIDLAARTLARRFAARPD